MTEIVFYGICISALCFIVDSFINLFIVQNYDKEKFAKRCNIYVGFALTLLFIEGICLLDLPIMSNLEFIIVLNSLTLMALCLIFGADAIINRNSDKFKDRIVAYLIIGSIGFSTLIIFGLTAIIATLLT